MAVITPTLKFQLYQSLFNLNQAFETVTHEIENMRHTEVGTRDTLNLQQSIAEELRAGLNHMIVDKLEAREVEDWYLYGKQRIEQEKQLAEQ